MSLCQERDILLNGGIVPCQPSLRQCDNTNSGQVEKLSGAGCFPRGSCLQSDICLRAGGDGRVAADQPTGLPLVIQAG